MTSVAAPPKNGARSGLSAGKAARIGRQSLLLQRHAQRLCTCTPLFYLTQAILLVFSALSLPIDCPLLALGGQVKAAGAGDTLAAEANVVLAGHAAT